ncbi:MAG: PD-(D/E)XK nuclease family protein [Dehalococcoidales bacterium]|nr:PD-(D/E)XK nuclease family protein [Dehalococcoidales bacterium]
MARKRQSPYIWTTWLTRLLVGEHSCEWGAWFKTHHESNSYEKIPGSFDLTAWQVEHTTRVKEIREKLEVEGKTVFLESQNGFVLRGATAALGGRPDLISTFEGNGIIIDIKTGKPSPTHHVQVMVYMYAVPKVLQQYRGIEFDGRVIYSNHEVSIPASAVDEKFISNLSSLIRRLSSTTPPRKISNPVECGFCDITANDCPERAADAILQEGETGDF